jgi:hypothetical protein
VEVLVPDPGKPSTRFSAATSRRRTRQTEPGKKREHQVSVYFNDDEYQAMVANAEAARAAPAAWCARAASAPGMAVRLVAAQDARAAMLAELLGVHRQLVGAARNLNQVTAKLHSLNERPEDLDAVVAYMDRVAKRVDDAVTALAAERRG